MLGLGLGLGLGREGRLLVAVLDVLVSVLFAWILAGWGWCCYCYRQFVAEADGGV